MRADLKTRMSSYQIAINNGILNANEVRQLENRNPYAGGDKFHMPMNLAEVGGMNEDSDEDRDGGAPAITPARGGRALPPSAPGAAPNAPPAALAALSANVNGDHAYILGVMEHALKLLPEQARISNPPPASERSSSSSPPWDD